VKVVWTEHSLQTLQEIEDYIARDSPQSAARFIERLIERGSKLSSFPRAGRPVPELASPSIREVFEGNYRIVYRVREKDIQILAIFDGHRLLAQDDAPPIQ